MESELVDTKLHEAVRFGDEDETIVALKEGFDPNQIGIYQWSPLHEACNNGDTMLVRLLLKYGGNPDKCDMLRGCTSLHYAASQGYSNILKILLERGGTHNVENNHGETPLQVAVGDDCKKILREYNNNNSCKTNTASLARNNDLAWNTSKDVILETVTQDILSELPSNKTNLRKDSETDSAFSLDTDNISVCTTSSSSSRPHMKAWSPESAFGLGKELVLGHIQLSFEYNAKKSTFKIRVWQLLDLLLPPVETSMIHGIYVKGHLTPDPKRDTKRKTEEVRADQVKDEDIRNHEKNVVNFLPANFKFKKALEYNSVSHQMVQDKIIEIEVCITQRYTRRSFVVATWNMPLSMAVKKIRKEKFNLKPKISTHIPENMKVYNAGEMDIVYSNRFYSSNQSLSRLSSRSDTNSWAIPYEERAASDSNLNSVLVNNLAKRSPSFEMSMPEENDNDLEIALKDIAIMESKENFRTETKVNLGNIDKTTKTQDRSKGKPSASVKRGSIPGFLGEDKLDLDDGNFDLIDPSRITEVQVHVPKNFTKRNGSSASNKSTKLSRILKSAENKSKQTQLHNAPPKIVVDSANPSRPETPTWDYYEEPLGFNSVDMEPFEIDDLLPLDADPSQPRLPMAVSLDLPKVHQVQKQSKDLEDEVESQTVSRDTTVAYQNDNESNSKRSTKRSPRPQVKTSSESIVSYQNDNEDTTRRTTRNKRTFEPVIQNSSEPLTNPRRNPGLLDPLPDIKTKSAVTNERRAKHRMQKKREVKKKEAEFEGQASLTSIKSEDSGMGGMGEWEC